MVLTSEFAAVSVEVEQVRESIALAITDLGLNLTARLDARAALQAPIEGPIEVDLDQAANGPRLKISAGPETVYLDPLQLSDAASTGCWATFPAAYQEQPRES
ncbi:MAG TPA: hypothetical protein VKU60_19515 [Chloroflexota bacterium]|nr:hypothetical protein [Chloroflexota bacterium]